MSGTIVNQMSLFLKPIRSWNSHFKSTISLGQRQISNINKPINEPSSNNTIQNSTIPLEDGRPDELYRYLWIKCSGYEHSVLNSYEKFLTLAAQHLGVQHVKTEEPHRYFYRRTLLASRHVHKKYRVQYEIRNYYRNLLFENVTGSTADTFLEYVERNIPEGVLFIAEKHRLGEFPFELQESQQLT